VAVREDPVGQHLRIDAHMLVEHAFEYAAQIKRALCTALIGVGIPAAGVDGGSGHGRRLHLDTGQLRVDTGPARGPRRPYGNGRLCHGRVIERARANENQRRARLGFGEHLRSA
jgi:hypothetical protein